MGEYVEFTFEDGQSVLLEVFPSPLGEAAQAPPGAGHLEPVAGSGGLVSRAARGTLRTMLRPLVPVLETVHETVNGLAVRPDEIGVEIGVRFTNDLRLGIVSARGEANLVVKAVWKPTGEGPDGTPDAPPDGPPDETPGGGGGDS
ncbi:CU044_2847 family protein [Streptomyces sp. NPDC001941]|uniref:CU044_2847 family protein n=1 Tax=Streptomyces sp. NPDC001941 TaxID=3154659 RepID=UPI0033278E33